MTFEKKVLLRPKTLFIWVALGGFLIGVLVSILHAVPYFAAHKGVAYLIVIPPVVLVLAYLTLFSHKARESNRRYLEALKRRQYRKQEDRDSLSLILNPLNLLIFVLGGGVGIGALSALLRALLPFYRHQEILLALVVVPPVIAACAYFTHFSSRAQERNRDYLRRRRSG